MHEERDVIVLVTEVDYINSKLKLLPKTQVTNP